MRACGLRSTAWLMILSCVAVPAGPAAAADGTPPKRYAVLIGINDYADKLIPDLKCAEADARALRKVLTDPATGMFPPGNVEMILGEAATPTNIKKALSALRTVGEDDLVIVFYSGHGAKEGAESFWVTQQAELGDLTSTAFSNTEVKRFLDRIPSRRMVVLLDCCYAAATVKDRKSIADTSTLWQKFSGEGRVVISGAGDAEEALEMPEVGLGVFTYYLTQGLAGKADANTDGVVTLAEAYTYLSTNVEAEAKKRRGLQKANLQGETSGQFLLTLNPGVRAADQARLKKLLAMLQAGTLSGEHYDEAKGLLAGTIVPPAQAKVRQVYVDLADGKIDPKYLESALAGARKAGGSGHTVIPRTGNPSLAVVDFQVIGDLGIKEAGKAVAELLMPHFVDDYQLIERRQLQKLLEEDGLTMSDLAAAAAPPTKAVKLRQVQYLVIGSVVRLGSISATARMVEWQTGRVVKSATVSASDPRELEARLGQLAAILQGQAAQPVVVPLPADDDDDEPLPPPPPGDDIQPVPPGTPAAITNSLGMKFVLIRGGTFTMGSPKSDRERRRDEVPHQVVITRPFYMGATEVSQSQYEQVMGDNPSEGEGPNRPVDSVTWDEAVAFCNKLTAREQAAGRLEPGQRYRLPTEAEWEYACRAGATTRYCFGEDESQLDDYGWYSGNTGHRRFLRRVYRTQDVGTKKPNTWGLYDMHGNVYEWCADWEGPYPKTRQIDPRGPSKGRSRVLRGGSYRRDASLLRAAFRHSYRPSTRGDDFGFRCVLTLPSSP